MWAQKLFGTVNQLVFSSLDVARRWGSLAALIAVAKVATACYGEAELIYRRGHPTQTAPDGGVPDGGLKDGGVDGGVIIPHPDGKDAGVDAGVPDAGPSDAGQPGAGNSDAGIPDGGTNPPDGGPVNQWLSFLPPLTVGNNTQGYPRLCLNNEPIALKMITVFFLEYCWGLSYNNLTVEQKLNELKRRIKFAHDNKFTGIRIMPESHGGVGQDQSPQRLYDFYPDPDLGPQDAINLQANMDALRQAAIYADQLVRDDPDHRPFYIEITLNWYDTTLDEQDGLMNARAELSIRNMARAVQRLGNVFPVPVNEPVGYPGEPTRTFRVLRQLEYINIWRDEETRLGEPSHRVAGVAAPEGWARLGLEAIQEQGLPVNTFVNIHVYDPQEDYMNRYFRPTADGGIAWVNRFAIVFGEFGNTQGMTSQAIANFMNVTAEAGQSASVFSMHYNCSPNALERPANGQAYGMELRWNNNLGAQARCWATGTCDPASIVYANLQSAQSTCQAAASLPSKTEELPSSSDELKCLAPELCGQPSAQEEISIDNEDAGASGEVECIPERIHPNYHKAFSSGARTPAPQ